ncbi:MAG TPA: Xaa-Pro peptidase family protein [Dehalococcoidia bacterium]|nr:Xaa-Pro peptidase family protein [Dehalococcoidia bacterium]
MNDQQRAGWIADGMQREGFTALLCRLPQHVVMLTGYQPVLGNSFCLVTLRSDGQPEARLAVPADEQDLVPKGAAASVKPYAEETMEKISTTIPSVRGPLGELVREAGVGGGAVVGIEAVQSPVASHYTQIGTPGPATTDMIAELVAGAELRDATALLDDLSSVKSEDELRWIRRAEETGRAGFEAARTAIRPGATEAEVAGATYAGLLRAGYAVPGAWHVTAYVHVMSGPRAAEAYKAFNLTGSRTIERGDTVSVQMEVAVNGYWAELTRPFFAGEASDRWRAAHAACVKAQEAALRTIRAGVSGHDADAAARRVMQQAGFGEAFKHGLGHGFGFQAINHAAEPVLHPASRSVLRAGQVHNMEPAVYLDGVGGIRLNDNVLVRQDGNELLSAAIPRDLDWLIVGE